MKLGRFGFIGLLAVGLFGFPLINAQAQVICTGNASPPPELPDYDQPAMPDPGYIWTPGYWDGGPLGYFWVPGTWVEPPAVGLLWTPGYWAFRDGIYVWNAGYWGPHVGFYGGVDYGFGYGGDGYQGGRWVDGAFSYNRSVNNFGSVRVTNVYEERVTVNNVTRVSFNGGSGGIAARPTPQQEVAAREQHVAALPMQIQHERTAATNKALLASENHGRPAIAATAKPGEFNGRGVVAAREPKPGEQGLQKPNNALRPAAIGNPPKEQADLPKAKEMVKPGVQPNLPANNAAAPNTKPQREQAKLPAGNAEPPKLHEKLPEGAVGAGNPALKVPKEQAETPKLKDTVKREGEPNPPPNNARAPNGGPPHEQAKLPAGNPNPPNAAVGNANPPKAVVGNPNPPKLAVQPNANPKPKPGPNDKKPPQ